MLRLSEARRLLEALVEVIEPRMPAGGMPGWRRIARPALVTENWGDFDLQAATLPLVQPKSAADMDELYSGLIDLYVVGAGSDTDKNVFSHIRDELGLGRNDSAMLFPTRRGKVAQGNKDVPSALAAFLWCAKSMGYELTYGENTALANLEGRQIGVRNGVAQCGYSALCVPVPQFDYRQFYEQPRVEGGNEPDELFLLYVRSRSALLDPILVQAVRVLTWAARREHPALLSRFDELVECAGVNDKKLRQFQWRVQHARSPIKELQSLLVPKFVSQYKYSKVVKRHRLNEFLWEPKEKDAFVLSTLESLGLTYNNNKGKTQHVSSNNRQSGRR